MTSRADEGYTRPEKWLTIGLAVVTILCLGLFGQAEWLDWAAVGALLVAAAIGLRAFVRKGRLRLERAQLTSSAAFEAADTVFSVDPLAARPAPTGLAFPSAPPSVQTWPAGETVVPGDTSSVRQSPFSSVRTVADATQILVGIAMVMSVGLLVSLIRRIVLLEELRNNPGSLYQNGAGSITFDQVVQADSSVRHWTIAWTLTFVVSAIAFLVWFYRVRRNAGRWAPGGQRRSQGWAFWAWICPVVTLWFPLQIAIDALRGSQPSTSTSPPRTGLIGAWWAFWLAITALTTIANVVSRQADTISRTITINQLLAARALAVIAAGMLAILVVRKLTALQLAKVSGADFAGYQGSY